VWARPPLAGDDGPGGGQQRDVPRDDVNGEQRFVHGGLLAAMVGAKPRGVADDRTNGGNPGTNGRAERTNGKRKWWTRSQPIRTVAQSLLVFPLTETRQLFEYQQIRERASLLHRLGMSASSIGRRLGVSDKTVTKALRRFEDAD
jgi:hypothetical protein